MSGRETATTAAAGKSSLFLSPPHRRLDSQRLSTHTMHDLQFKFGKRIRRKTKICFQYPGVWTIYEEEYTCLTLSLLIFIYQRANADLTLKATTIGKAVVPPLQVGTTVLLLLGTATTRTPWPPMAMMALALITAAMSTPQEVMTVHAATVVKVRLDLILS